MKNLIFILIFIVGCTVEPIETEVTQVEEAGCSDWKPCADDPECMWRECNSLIEHMKL